jgi:hypothetical protein
MISAQTGVLTLRPHPSTRVQGELEKADATNAAFEDHLDSALKTGALQ